MSLKQLGKKVNTDVNDKMNIVSNIDGIQR